MKKLKVYLNIINPKEINCAKMNNEDIRATSRRCSGVYISVDIYLFIVNNRNTGTMLEICSKLTIKTIFEFENISQIF